MQGWSLMYKTQFGWNFPEHLPESGFIEFQEYYNIVSPGNEWINLFKFMLRKAGEIYTYVWFGKKEFFFKDKIFE